MPRLIVIKGADEGKQFELTGDHFSLGRDSSNRIRLHDTEISRKHADFVRTGEGYRVVDLGSANGTYVNERAIRDVLLQSGDQVQIGQTILVYTANRAEMTKKNDLADRINLISRQELELSSAIIKTIGESEGSRLLTLPEKADVPFLRANLGIIYEAIQAASHIVDINELLDRILELTFRSIDADRGCILLRETLPGEVGAKEPPRNSVLGADFQAQAVRWRDGVNRQETINVSRTMIDHVLREKQGILVSDASQDDRFQSVQSIVRYGIREMICVPVRGRHETLGILYLDSLSPRSDRSLGQNFESKFKADHLSLAIALAHQAGLAVEETRYYQAFVQAERLAAVGQTVAALSHHIKNILQGLRSGGEIITIGLKDHDFNLMQQGWRIVEKNQGKIYDLVMDMLSYSKEREPNFEEIDVNALVREVVELVAGRATALNVDLQTDLQPLPLCQADREGFHRALLNIVGNALDAVEESEKPSVIIRTGIDQPAAQILIAVTDNGPGIAPGKRHELFKPFVSTKGSRGTGLGLAVSRKILRENGGDVVVISQPGQGSTFTLQLPLREVSPAVDSATQANLPVVPPPE